VVETVDGTLENGIITGSFLADVEQAICDEVNRLCASGGEAYAVPKYLQLKTCRLGKVIPQAEWDDDEVPAYVIQYLFREDIPPGTQTRGGDYEYLWNCFAVIRYTPESMGYGAEPTEAEFYKACYASTEVLKQRIGRAMRSFAPTVQYEDEASGNLELGRHRFVLFREGTLAWRGEIVWEVLMRTEDLKW